MPRSASIMGRLSRAIHHFYKEDSGVAAIEFGIFAAVLVPLFLIATDIGFILRERIVLEHVLRMGAYTAIADNPSPARVEDVMRRALEDQQSPRITPTALLVDSTCFCRLQPAADISCSVSCAPDNRIEAYEMQVAVDYNSIFMPHALSLNLSMLTARLRVEIPSLEN